jgi:hydroxymethylpyrimidine/phosphomethylpyrimidine kinase
VTFAVIVAFGKTRAGRLGTPLTLVAFDAITAELIVEQMSTALAVNHVTAVKVGMLGTAVTSVLQAHPDIAVVLDPVLASSSGRSLLEMNAIARPGRPI